MLYELLEFVKRTTRALESIAASLEKLSTTVADAPNRHGEVNPKVRVTNYGN